MRSAGNYHLLTVFDKSLISSGQSFFLECMKVAYWITTVVFGGFMLFSAIGEIFMLPEASEYITALGYPAYLVPFLGYAKALGVIALFVPGFPRIREWAYAGLFFDLCGATYSNLAVHGFEPGMLYMLVFFGLFFTSYYLNMRLNQA
jgi:hypothetical protein